MLLSAQYSTQSVFENELKNSTLRTQAPQAVTERWISSQTDPTVTPPPIKCSTLEPPRVVCSAHSSSLYTTMTDGSYAQEIIEGYELYQLGTDTKTGIGITN